MEFGNIGTLLYWLDWRRLRADLIEAYKILTGKENIHSSQSREQELPIWGKIYAFLDMPTLPFLQKF